MITKYTLSPYKKAYQRLRAAIYIKLIADKDIRFAKNLCDFYKAKNRMSEKQYYWATKLVDDALSKKQQKKETNIYLHKICDMFEEAIRNKIQQPKCVINFNDGKLHLSYITYGQYQGFIKIHDGKKQNRLTYGFINWKDQLLLDIKINKTLTDQVAQRLIEFDKNPVKEAKAYGHKTGICCFCFRQLTTKESVYAGYGPICADNFGLPWGDTEESTQFKDSLSKTLEM